VSKYQFKASDIYLPGTDIPKNRLGIEDAELLHEIEKNLLIASYRIQVSELQPETRFDETYFIGLHKHTFASLYDWAGEYRSEDMSKGESLFCLAQHLPAQMKRLFHNLEQERFLRQAKSTTKEHFAERLAYYQCELIALHPFYELNGRITRQFFDLIAIANGYYPIDYSQALNQDAIPNSYIEASIACVQRADNRQLQQFILDGLTRMDEAI